MLCIVQSHAQFKQPHYDPSSPINTNTGVSSGLAQQLKFMFALSFGCSHSACYRGIIRGCTARPPLFHCTSPTLTEPVPTVTFMLSAHLCMVRNILIFSLTLFIASLFPSFFHLYLKTSATLNPSGFYSFN